MGLKMVVRAQIEKPEKRQAIKRLAEQGSNRHARCMSPVLALCDVTVRGSTSAFGQCGH
jgi:hypothetical protein